MTFPEAVDAQYALETLQVDAEIQPDKIHRSLSVEGANLIVYVQYSHKLIIMRVCMYNMSTTVHTHCCCLSSPPPPATSKPRRSACCAPPCRPSTTWVCSSRARC